MDYLNWNNLIVKHFFNEQMAGREVILYVDNELIEMLGSDAGVGVPDFIASVKVGPPWVTRSGFCQKAFQAYSDWRSRGLDYPPYVAYLATFVMATGVETDYAPQAYYPLLWKLLGEPESGMPPSFDRMLELWDDLEKWSCEDKHESLGHFIAWIRGNWCNVGLPLSQTIISGEERKRLFSLFVEAGLDPTDLPSSELMLKVLKRYGPSFLGKRTRRLLESDKKEDVVLRNGLIEFVLNELEEWDGTFLSEEPTEEKEVVRARVNQSGLRVCLQTDLVSNSVSAYLRFKTGRLFPDEGLSFRHNADEEVWFCAEAYNGWSTPLKSFRAEASQRFDAASLNWEDESLFTDSEHHWRARLMPAQVRLFRLGIDNLPDWVETQRFERGIEFLVACRQQDSELLQKWGKEYCEKFVRKEMRGLPVGWLLFLGKNAVQSCPGIDILSVSPKPRLLLRNGIKAGTGNAYFKFAPPEIVLENSSGSEKVFVNGRPLRQSTSSPQLWELPEDIPVGEPVKIEAEIGNDEWQKRIFKLLDFELAQSFDDKLFRDPLGETCSEATDGCVCGVIVHNQVTTVSYPGVLPTYLSNHIFFVGERPGQISEWPVEPPPEEWHPVWAIAKTGRKDWKVHFCGKPEHTSHGPGTPLDDRVSRKRWKEALWVRRKVIEPPELGQLKSIWKKYLEASRNV